MMEVLCYILLILGMGFWLVGMQTFGIVLVILGAATFFFNRM